jgi:hypothetical protein
MMDELREQLEALAEEGTTRGATAVLRDARQELAFNVREAPARAPRSQWRRIVGVAAAAVVVVAVAVSAVVATRDSDESPKILVPAGGSEQSYRDLYDTSDQPLDAPLYLVPGAIPAGFTLRQIDDHPVSSIPADGAQVDRLQAWVRLDDSRERAVESIYLIWGLAASAPNGDANAPASTDPLVDYRDSGTPTEIRGHDGIVIDTPTVHKLVWEEPAGKVTSLTSPSVPITTLTTMADALTTTSDGAVRANEVPDGFVQVADQPGMPAVGSDTRDLSYVSDDGQRGFRVRVDDNTDLDPGLALLAMTAQPPADLQIRIVDIAGRHAIASNAPANTSGDGEQISLFGKIDESVQWLAPANTLVTVSGVGLSADQVLATAAGLQSVDRATWDQMLATNDGTSPEQPTLSLPSVPTTTTAPEPVFDGEKAAVAQMMKTWASRPSVDTTVALVEDGEALRETIVAVKKSSQVQAARDPGIRVRSIELVGDDHAIVTFDILQGDNPSLADQTGVAVKIDGSWRLSRDTYCRIAQYVQVACPAP